MLKLRAPETPGPSHFPLYQESNPSHSTWLILFHLSGLCLDISHFWNSPASEPSRAGVVSTVLPEAWPIVGAP